MSTHNVSQFFCIKVGYKGVFISWTCFPDDSLPLPFQIQLYQLTRLIHDNYKDLYDHFEVHEIAPTLYAAPWFLTLFASQFPLGFVGRVFGMYHKREFL